MTISLVSAPILGFDLARHPAGPAIAHTLLVSLTLGPHDLSCLDTAPLRALDSALAELETTRSGLGTGSLRGSALRPAPSPGTVLGGMITALRRSMINDLDDLEYLVRTDVLGWADHLRADSTVGDSVSPETYERAVTCVVHALAADWVDGLDPSIQSDLRAPFESLRTTIGPRHFDVGPCSETVSGILGRLEHAGVDGCSRLRQVTTLLGTGGGSWAEAMHEATWAAFTTGRIRAAASAQLLGVKAFVAGGLDAGDGAEGVWNLISARLHAEVVADVLPAAVKQRLSRGWRAALGD